MSSKGATTTARWGPFKSLLVLAPLLIGAPIFTVYRHYGACLPVFLEEYVCLHLVYVQLFRIPSQNCMPDSALLHV